VFLEKHQSVVQAFHVLEHILPDHSHHFPQGLSGLKSAARGKTLRHRHIDGRIQFVEDIPVDT
jgi:hypothetical protein